MSVVFAVVVVVVVVVVYPGPIPFLWHLEVEQCLLLLEAVGHI